MDRPLSALELTALGIVLKRGPCLAHAVVSEFSGSQTFAYRSGAGSIYPLLTRLTQAGLLGYAEKRYTLTDEGREALRTWIRPPFDGKDFSTNLDVLRSRVYFLRLLSPQEIEEFLTEAIGGLRTLLTECEGDLDGYRKRGDPFSELAMLGAVRETEARIAWLEEVRMRLASGNLSAVDT